MGLFSSRGTTPAQPTFNGARIAPVLEALEINFGIDDGVHIALWDDCRTLFEAVGEPDEVLAMRAYWDFRPDVAAQDRLLEAVNRWNVTRRWPRALLVPAEDGELPLVVADMAVDLEPGASDELVRQQIMCFVSTALDFFSQMAEDFPEHTTWVNDRPEEPEA